MRFSRTGYMCVVRNYGDDKWFLCGFRETVIQTSMIRHVYQTHSVTQTTNWLKSYEVINHSIFRKTEQILKIQIAYFCTALPSCVNIFNEHKATYWRSTFTRYFQRLEDKASHRESGERICHSCANSAQRNNILLVTVVILININIERCKGSDLPFFSVHLTLQTRQFSCTGS